MTLSKNSKNFKYAPAYWDRFATDIKRPVIHTALKAIDDAVIREIIKLQVFRLGAIMK